MTDNTVINAGAGGDTIATDDIGGVKWQRVKMTLGADGVNNGDVSSANPMPVINSALGEVQAVPTTYTVLARLKDLLTGIVLAAGTNIIGKVGIDQTTPGTTDSVTIKASVGIGSLTETAPATDTASSGLNGRLQRVAQRLTSLIALLPTSLGAGGGLKIDGSGTALPVSMATAPTLVAGSAIIGKVGVDQTTPGTTDAVTVKATGVFVPIGTSTLTNVAASATTVTLVASNTNRKRIILHNDSTAKLYIKFGATASTSSFTFPLNSYETYDTGDIISEYKGIIDGIWASATGNLRVTELT